MGRLDVAGSHFSTDKHGFIRNNLFNCIIVNFIYGNVYVKQANF